MENTLKIKIVNLLKKGDLLSFTSDNARQGGPLVNIVLNNKSIGEVYTYNSTENRYENIPQGNLLELETDGLLSVCIQHEIDHLLGKVFVEYLSPLKKNRIKSKMIKQSKQKKIS